MRDRSLLDLVSKFLRLIRRRIVFRPRWQSWPIGITSLGELRPISRHEIGHPLIVCRNLAPTAGPKPSREEARFKAMERTEFDVGLRTAGIGEVVVPNSLSVSCGIPCKTMRRISEGVVGIEARKRVVHFGIAGSGIQAKELVGFLLISKFVFQVGLVIGECGLSLQIVFDGHGTLSRVAADNQGNAGETSTGERNCRLLG